MNILEMNITVDKLPDGCNVDKPGDTECIFNCWKYCILKMALKNENCFVQNNRGTIPDDCPIKHNLYKVGQKIEFTQVGMEPLLHGKIIKVHPSYVEVKCKNGCKRYPSLKNIIRIMEEIQ